MCSARLVQAGEVLLQSPYRLFFDKFYDWLDEFVVSRVQINVEDAWHKNGIADLEQASICIPDQLGDNVVARDLARNAFGHTRQTSQSLLIASDVTWGRSVAQAQFSA
jgi:hypothetical protein